MNKVHKELISKFWLDVDYPYLEEKQSASYYKSYGLQPYIYHINKWDNKIQSIWWIPLKVHRKTENFRKCTHGINLQRKCFDKWRKNILIRNEWKKQFNSCIDMIKLKYEDIFVRNLPNHTPKLLI
jgi:hypothetical protein